MADFTNSLSAGFVSDLMSLHAKIDALEIDKARNCLLDFLGVALAGAGDTNSKSGALRDILTSSGYQSNVNGLTPKTDLLSAALLNGINAHRLELDDGHRYGMVHPGATVIAALLPLASSIKAEDLDLLRAIVVGYEAAIKVAIAVQPGMKHRGYHATGTCGALGAAMGAGFLLKQNRNSLHTTLCVAATQAAGLLQVIKNGSDLKPFNAGQAALNGLVAATMGQAGYTGPPDVFSGEHGLLSILSDQLNISELTTMNTKVPAIHGIYVKPYAACRHCHPAIEAALQLRDCQDFDVNKIQSIRVETYDLAVKYHDHKEVVNSADARMSTPYSVAAALKYGSAGIEVFSATELSNGELASVRGKVEVIENKAFSERVPHERTARVTINFKGGRAMDHTILFPRGEPENPLQSDEHLKKFEGLCAHAGLDDAKIDEIVSYVSGEKVGISALYDTL